MNSRSSAATSYVLEDVCAGVGRCGHHTDLVLHIAFPPVSEKGEQPPPTDEWVIQSLAPASTQTRMLSGRLQSQKDKRVLGWGVAQQESPCLAGVRPWVRCPTVQKRREKYCESAQLTLETWRGGRGDWGERCEGLQFTGETWRGD